MKYPDFVPLVFFVTVCPSTTTSKELKTWIDVQQRLHPVTYCYVCTGTILSIKKALDIGISLSLTCIPRYSETCCNQAEEDNNKVFILIGPVQHHSLLYCGCIVTISTDLAYILTETKINLWTLL